MNKSARFGALVEASNAPRGWSAGGCSPPRREGSGDRARPSPEKFHLTSKWNILVLCLSWIFRRNNWTQLLDRYNYVCRRIRLRLLNK